MCNVYLQRGVAGIEEVAQTAVHYHTPQYIPLLHPDQFVEVQYDVVMVVGDGDMHHCWGDGGMMEDVHVDLNHIQRPHPHLLVEEGLDGKGVYP